jgi:RNA polymerase sigma-70 factor (ECF subfamily)
MGVNNILFSETLSLLPFVALSPALSKINSIFSPHQATLPYYSHVRMKKQMPYVSSAEEKELVAGCLRGDQKAQKFLFERSYGKLLGICMRYAASRDDAKDILQDAFIKIFQKMHQYSTNNPLDAWMRRIVVNTAIDRFRSQSAVPVVEDIDTAYGYHDDSHDVVSEMSHVELLQCLNDLPPGYKLVFNMYAIEGFSHKEIADLLGITEGTSKSQLAKARAYLQKMLTRKYAGGNE